MICHVTYGGKYYKDKIMKHTILIFPTAALALATLACQFITPSIVQGSGNASTEVREVSNFNEIILEGMGNVFITVGETEELSIQADDNLLPLLTAEVQNGALKLGVVRGTNINPVEPITYNVTIKELNGISLAGSGNIYSEPLQSNDLKVTVAGSGDVEVKGLSGTDLSINLPGSGNITINQIDVTSIDTSIYGSGDIKLNGKADNQSIDVYGSGKYIAGDLETANTNILIQGSSNLTVWVENKLDIRVNGSGDVSYYGRPTINQGGYGSGNVSSLGEK